MRTRRKLCRNSCLAAWLLAGLLWTNAAFATVLSVQQHYQEQDQWCWDATSQAILEYYGVYKTQTAIAAYGTGGLNIPNYLYGQDSTSNGVDYILMHFAGLNTWTYSDILTQAYLTSQINSFRPVGIRWGWDTGGGHILAIKGIAGNTVYLMDPWYGDTEISTYGWVVRSVSDGHTWTDSLTMDTAPSQIFAAIDTPAYNSITTTKATLGATIESQGATNVTASGVAYSKQANPTNKGTKVSTSPLATGGAFTVNAGGLASNTIYHFRGYATNSSGTSYTSDSTFATVAGAPKATAATAINHSGFTAHWKAPSGNAPIISYWLRVATDPGFTNLVFNGSLTGTSHVVSSLSTGTYYYRVWATNTTPWVWSVPSGTIKVKVK